MMAGRAADRSLQALRAYYGRGLERDRLAGAMGTVEFERTREILLRHLPPPPCVVADIGGGAGRYARWLHDLGYFVRHRDIVPLHVEQLRADATELQRIETAVGDARSLDLNDASVDAVLLLGPLYHLERRADRLQALREARRIARPGAPVFAAAISRWSPRLDDVLAKRLYESFPEALDFVTPVERSGRLPPLVPGSFCGYCHRPRQLRAEVRDAGLDVISLVGIEGVSFLLNDLAERLGDPRARRVVFDGARAIESVPELLGVSPHMLATAVTGQRRPRELPGSDR